MLVLSVTIKYKSKRVDHDIAFLYASLEDDLLGGASRFLSAKKNLEAVEITIWIKAEAKDFFEHLKERFFWKWHKQRANHHFFLFQGNLFCVAYVDDCLVFSEINKDTDEAVQH